MSRGLDRDDIDRNQEPAPQGRTSVSQGRGGGATSATEGLRQQQRPPVATRTRGRPESRRHRQVPLRDRVLNLSEAELHTMRDIGRFRTVGEDDLLRFRYQANASKLHRDYLNLKAQGLVERRTVSVGKTRRPLPVYTLTREGKKALKNAGLDRSDQALYAGFVKPREAAHDAAIYRMFQAEAARIEAQGGRVDRVVLDFEFKKKIYCELAKAHGLGARQYADRQAEIAAANGLAVLDGKIPMPDLRIEYEAAEGEQARIDLELVTEHYRRDHLSEKARAGFKIYGFTSTSGGSSAEWEGREITPGILSL